jgi:excisionase family DNA binding protein
MIINDIDYLTVKETSQLTGLHELTIRSYMKKGLMQFIRPSYKLILIPRKIAESFKKEKTSP